MPERPPPAAVRAARARAAALGGLRGGAARALVGVADEALARRMIASPRLAARHLARARDALGWGDPALLTGPLAPWILAPPAAAARLARAMGLCLHAGAFPPAMTREAVAPARARYGDEALAFALRHRALAAPPPARGARLPGLPGLDAVERHGRGLLRALAARRLGAGAPWLAGRLEEDAAPDPAAAALLERHAGPIGEAALAALAPPDADATRDAPAAADPAPALDAAPRPGAGSPRGAEAAPARPA